MPLEGRDGRGEPGDPCDHSSKPQLRPPPEGSRVLAVRAGQLGHDPAGGLPAWRPLPARGASRCLRLWAMHNGVEEVGPCLLGHRCPRGSGGLGRPRTRRPRRARGSVVRCGLVGGSGGLGLPAGGRDLEVVAREPGAALASFFFFFFKNPYFSITSRAHGSSP